MQTPAPLPSRTPLSRRIAGQGQPVWLDSIGRGHLESGMLREWVAEGALAGAAFSLAALEKEMGQGDAYDARIRELARQRDWEVKDLYEELLTEDVRAAADALQAAHEGSGGRDGFVSLEASPHFARDPERLAREARALWKRIDRPNAMIRIPAYPGTRDVVRRLLAEGIPVDVGPVFSREAYEAAADAYLDALEERERAGLELDRVAGVVSFDVSRIDVAAERAAGSGKPPRGLGPASARQAYALFGERSRGLRWRRLAARGARPQRLAWIGGQSLVAAPDTVVSLPAERLASWEAGADTGLDLADGDDQPRGAHLETISRRLAEESVLHSMAAFDRLMKSLWRKKESASLGETNAQELRFPIDLLTPVGETLGEWRVREKLFGLWNGDPALRLPGPRERGARAAELEDAAREARGLEIRDVVLLGDSGASLAAEVIEASRGDGDPGAVLHVLDTTDPARILALEKRIDLRHALFVVSGRSGDELVPRLLLERFLDRARRALGDAEAPGRFMAITARGSDLETLARERGFRRVFVAEGDPEAGERFSALSSFGLAPVALTGYDTSELLRRAQRMANACSPNLPPEENPGATLGAALAALARRGIDKVTLFTSPELWDLSAWIERTLAESTGKCCKGLVPVIDEPAAPPPAYGRDRLFVHLRLQGSLAQPQLDAQLAALEAAGHPVIVIQIASRANLGQEFFRWEFAAALACSALQVDPSGRPDAEASASRARALIATLERDGALPPEFPFYEEGGLRLFADPANAGELRRLVPGPESLESYLRAHLARLRVGDYLALLAFVARDLAGMAPDLAGMAPDLAGMAPDLAGMAPDLAVENALGELRVRARARTRVATTLGFGPRYLHSTGQLHKGGAPNGLFLMLTADPARDVPLPGRGFGFAAVQAAQARADFEELAARGLRCLRVHLPADLPRGLARLKEAFTAALEPPHP